ncbi:hypothetical protein LR48_Vigan07g206800 [Vigna angularis]|uniref:Uncharacterized protein n=1 Tax=Phaseolus angularis TaxID=3914 RepID=A0A0L9V0S8_PHAAN|nr:hypothetical protein LR48_Vigan07g206800 [Vigna angularis]
MLTARSGLCFPPLSSILVNFPTLNIFFYNPFSSVQLSTVFNTVRSSTCVRPVLAIVRYSIEFHQCSTSFSPELFVFGHEQCSALSCVWPSSMFNIVRSSTCVRLVLVTIRYSTEFRQCSTPFGPELCLVSVHPVCSRSVYICVWPLTDSGRSVLVMLLLGFQVQFFLSILHLPTARSPSCLLPFGLGHAFYRSTLIARS